MYIVSFYINNFEMYKSIQKYNNEITLNGFIYKNSNTDSNTNNNIIGKYIANITLIDNFKFGKIHFNINNIGELSLPIYLNGNIYEILNYTNNYICIPDIKSNLTNNLIFNKKIKIEFKKTLLYLIYTLEYAEN